MHIIPAIDLKDGMCVRLIQGEYNSATKVADDPVEQAIEFERAGATLMHIVDLDGALEGKPVNCDIVFEIVRRTALQVQVGGGIRNMKDAEIYLNGGVNKVVIGSAAIEDKEFLKELVDKYGSRVIVSIDAKNGRVAEEGWRSISSIDCFSMAAEMEKLGVKNIIFTDISKNGTMDGPNLDILDKLNYMYSMNIIASGGISSLKDIINLSNLNIYGAVCGKAFYSGTMDLRSALTVAGLVEENSNRRKKIPTLEKYFMKSGLIPVIVQDIDNGEVLMLAHMNREALKLTLETGRTWFYSRSRHEIWNMGAQDGNYQNVKTIIADYDNEALLIRVEQIGNACPTGSHSFFFRVLQDHTQPEEEQ